MVDNKCVQKVQEYVCDKCDVICSTKWLLNRHKSTNKHKNHDNLLTNVDNKVQKSVACICGKKYNHRQSLSIHKKQCSMVNKHEEQTLDDIAPPSSQDHDPLPTNIILELIKQNQEFKQLLVEQNKQLYEKHEENMGLQKQLLDVVKDGKTINNNTINNNNNKTFNLQVFLNETCKDAMNIKDFIQSLELTLSDLEKVGELGYAEGITRMFIKGLNSLDITKRPIHCSDVKREIMHIKHEDKWEKDNANQDKLKNIIKQLTHKNIMMLDDWKKANPGCTAYDSRKYDHYLKLTMESMGPTDEDAEKRDFNKIIRRVAEHTTIDKKYLVV